MCPLRPAAEEMDCSALMRALINYHICQETYLSEKYYFVSYLRQKKKLLILKATVQTNLKEHIIHFACQNVAFFY